MPKREPLSHPTPGAIVGGGPAGLAAALFLEQRGLPTPVFEQSHQAGLSQHLIWLAPNGLRLLAQLQLLPQLKEAGVAQQTMSFVDHQLQPLMSIGGQALLQHCGHQVLAIKRGTLQQILQQRLQQVGGTLHTDHQLQGIRPSTEGVQLSFAQQRQHQARFVLAADGMGSTVRQQLFPTSRVRYQGLCTYLGISSYQHAGNYIGRTIEVWGQATRFVFTALDFKTVYWSAVVRRRHYTPNHAPIPTDLLELLLKEFSGYHPEIRQILRQGEHQSLKRCNFGVIAGLPAYSQGRVCLLGDAAHGMPPNLGQGASLAFEDALWCAHHITNRRPGSATPWFSGIARSRQSRGHTATRLASRINGLFQPPGRLSSQLRNHLAARLPAQLSQTQMRRFYNHQVLPRRQNPGERLRNTLIKGGYQLSRRTSRGYRVEVLQPQHRQAAAQLLAEQFCHREPLCRQLNLQTNQVQPFFMQLLRSLEPHNLSLVAMDPKGQLVGCITVEDHRHEFAPPTELLNPSLIEINRMLDSHPEPPEYEGIGYGEVYQCGLAAVARAHNPLPLLQLMGLHCQQRLRRLGYGGGYAKITNPRLLSRLNQLEKRFGLKYFRLRSELIPSQMDHSTAPSFKDYNAPISLYSWEN